MGIGTLFSLRNPLLFAGFAERLIPGVDAAIDRSGQEIVDLADKEVKGRLYPGHGYLTGALHDSYHGSYQRVGRSTIDIKYGTELYYAPFVEFRWGGSVAHFFPGMAEVERQVPEIMKRNIDGVFG